VELVDARAGCEAAESATLDALMLLVAAALAAASPAPPVEVVSREVTLRRHDVAPIEVRCNRTRRPCRGVLVLGVAQCGGPALDPDCQIPVGRRRFAIRARTTRTVFVHRSRPAEHAAAGPDSVVVRATPSIGRRAPTRRTRWTREVRLVAPSSVPRPVAGPRLQRAERMELGHDAVRFIVLAPLGTARSEGALADRELELHRRMSAPYVLGAESFAVTGEVWHGETPVGRDEFRRGERHPYRVSACDAASCREAGGEVTLHPDPGLVPQPVCVLRPL
jgi:hypothetical protein